MIKVTFSEHLKGIRSILADTESRMLAVAFWGRGAMTELGLDKGTKNTKIICDLMSGACCPEEIRDLIARFGKKNVKTRAGLHCKLYLGTDAMSIGSSNASTNGLGFEGAERSGNIEANIFVSDRRLLKEAEAAFKEWWASEDSFEITDDLLQKAEIYYKLRRNKRHSSQQKNPVLPSIFDLWNRSRASFRDIDFFVFGYSDGELSPKAKAQSERDKKRVTLSKRVQPFEIHTSDVFQFARGRVFLDLADWETPRFRPSIYRVVDQPNWKSKVFNKTWINVYIEPARDIDLPASAQLSESDILRIKALLPQEHIRRKYSLFCHIATLLRGKLKSLACGGSVAQKDAYKLPIVLGDDRFYYRPR